MEPISFECFALIGKFPYLEAHCVMVEFIHVCVGTYCGKPSKASFATHDNLFSHIVSAIRQFISKYQI